MTSAPIHQVGLGVQGNLPINSYAAIGQAAEAYGFDQVSVFGDVWFLPPIAPLILMAEHTSTIRLGPSCLNPFTLHPAEIVGQISALDAVSGGRAWLGLVRGAWLDGVGVKQPKPLAAMRELITIIRQMMSADDSGLDGSVFTVKPGQRVQYEIERPRVPIMVGTWSPKMSALAGELADEVKIGASANPEMARLVRGWVNEGAANVGRDGAEIGVSLGAVSVVDDDGDAAREVAKRHVARYLSVIGGLDPTIDLDDDVVAEIDSLLADGRDTEAGALISDDVLRCFAFAGTPQEVAQHAQDAYAAGATKVEFNSPYGLTNSEAGLKIIGERVLPLIKNVTAGIDETS